MITKYVKLMSQENPRGIVMEKSDIEDMKGHYFNGHTNVQVVPISREDYTFIVYGGMR